MQSRELHHWLTHVAEACDQVFAATAVDWVRQIQRYRDSGTPSALLWQASAESYRHPPHRIPHRDHVGGPYVNYWIFLDPQVHTARLHFEGGQLPDSVVQLTGDSAQDAAKVTQILEFHLDVSVEQGNWLKKSLRVLSRTR